MYVFPIPGAPWRQIRPSFAASMSSRSCQHFGKVSGFVSMFIFSVFCSCARGVAGDIYIVTASRHELWDIPHIFIGFRGIYGGQIGAVVGKAAEQAAPVGRLSAGGL